MATHLKNLSDFSHTTIPSGKDFKIAIVVAEWNAKITGALYQGAFDTLIKHEVSEENILSLTVPGTFELAGAADILLNKMSDIDAVICIGCVIQGDTKHFDFICDAAAQGITNVGIKYSKPVIFGVLTTNDEQQAIDRAGGKHGNKGDEAAITALKMADYSCRL
ncbi:6,7-dimethyl-8-ribityllumazine synthase [Pedobacter xixiisoli]|uniref:6,7-dimethyl-8-ribityllumazine synthase n=1 Tax=Pedobacter xixiisoli TaxID=1476464 RepID=A0A286A8B2_9SPHI|nr:6,7-dimethyl-8-ribityllumazine synthase [Pedobacter xixiisoli]SOD18132.1 6,7-dimethyl-8-ribityllumazine synthase [Pedobacter xixiisoli]